MTTNIMNFDDGYKAVINYDPEIEMFRGYFINLNGDADFYATNIDDLKKQGELSLNVFLEMCAEDKVEPKKHYSGKFNLRLNPELHERVATVAEAKGISINKLVEETLQVAL
ncbi:MAG: type II toxin-antitoxin system HicB family antitoxin [Gammaproteobacteria bacterium]|nr:type II toxin-antitoxin system HicB family antitoxin [Gammaproteobacteria bacterium]